MATIGYEYTTLADVAAAQAPGGTIAAVAEVISESNTVLENAYYMAGNLDTGNQSTQRTGLPSGSWREINAGVGREKTTRKPVVDTAGMLETYAEHDKFLANMGGNRQAFMASEDRGFLQGLGETLTDTVFYGNTNTDPEQFMGLSPRYATSQTSRVNRKIASYNTIALDVHAGGQGTPGAANCSSIWLVTFGPQQTFMFHPKGQMQSDGSMQSGAGITRNFQGEVTLIDPADSTKQYQGYRTHYAAHVGLGIADWRATARVANIVTGDLTNSDTSQDALIKGAILAQNCLRGQAGGRTMFFMNETLKTWFDFLAQRKANVNLTVGEFMGQPTTMLRGTPIMLCDALLDTEAEVTMV